MRQRLIPNENMYIKFNSFTKNGKVIVAEVLEFYDLDNYRNEKDKTNHNNYIKMIIRLPRESILMLYNNHYKFFEQEYKYKCFHSTLVNRIDIPHSLPL